jgi:hypothetical protein
MTAMTFRGNLCAALIFLAAATASAQDFRVKTQITKPGDRTPVGGSMVMFHAGKAYDSLSRGSQVTIFEPAVNRFVVLDLARRLKAEIAFDEIETILERTTRRAEQKLVSVHGSTDREEINSANLLKFQIHPAFEEKYDADRRQLVLSSKPLSYAVQ